MREALVGLLECPECRMSLTLKADIRSGPHVMEGSLDCSGCARSYPVTRGIPRLLPDAMRGALSARAFDALQRRTQRSFGYQWTRFGELHPEFEAQFIWFISPPITRSFFSGKRGIDAGCGFGRHMYWATKWGAEVVGVDLSAAVERAFQNTAHLPGAHVVQGDIHQLPVARGAFDFAYSLGVLHHLPDTALGLASVARCVRPGGTVITWLYAGGRGKWFARVEPLRRAVSRLPLVVLYFVSLAIAAVAYPAVVVPFRWLRRAGIPRPLLQWIPSHIKYYAEYPFRVYHADWVDRLSAPVRYYFTPPEAQALLERQGLERVEAYATLETGVTAVGRVPAEPRNP